MSKTHGAKDKKPRTRRANPRLFRSRYAADPDSSSVVKVPDRVLSHFEKLAEEAGDNGVVAYLSRLATFAVPGDRS